MYETDLSFLESLENVIHERIDTGAPDSYTASLAAAGNKRVAQKTGEEAVEVVLAAVAGDVAELTDEAADLLYHLLVLLAINDVKLADVVSVLQQRHNR